MILQYFCQIFQWNLWHSGNLLSQFNLWQKFRESNVFTKEFISRNIFSMRGKFSLHSVEICKFSPTIFCKNSVKLTFSLKSYTVNQFDEKFLQWGKISKLPHCTVTHYWQKFVKVTLFLLKKVSWFDEIFCDETKFFICSVSSLAVQISEQATSKLAETNFKQKLFNIQHSV